MNPLLEAEKKALYLFDEIEIRGLIKAGKSEHQLNTEVFRLAKELLNIDKYWHKRIVRAGANTLRPYDENPPDLIIQEDDIVFFDFGPIFEDWEADVGRTYVCIGNDPVKLRLKNDLESAWWETYNWYHQQKEISGAELFEFAVRCTAKYGWTFGGEIAGHIVGKFPHERLTTEDKSLYVHPENSLNMFLPDKNGKPYQWILEMHFVDRERKIGGFMEQLLSKS